MGVDLGPNKVNDGLVFGYDTGYGVATNSTATRHYSGFPVSNMLSYGAEFDSWTKARNSGSYPTVDVKVAKGPFPSTLADRLSLPSDGSYPRISQNFTPASTATHTFSVWLKGESEGQGCFIGSFRNSPWNSTSTTTFSITTEWVNYSFNITPLDTSTHQLYIGSHNSHGGKVFLMYGALLQTGGTKTAFTDGTRSSTQSLIDLTKTRDIDVSNVSFDSTGQPTFDGTDDRIVVNNFPHIWNGSVTYEGVVSWDDDTRSILFGNYNVGANDVNVEKLTSRKLRFYWNRGERDVTTGTNVVTTTGDYHHIVMIRDQSANEFRFYVDGSLVSTVANAGSNITSTGSTFRIGSDTRTGTTVHNGEIPVTKLYDRALTAAEVKQNFNAYKNRFNL